MTRLSASDCYSVLGLPVGAPWSEVKSAFRRLARSTHPDVGEGVEEGDFERISEAYMVLRDMFRSGQTFKEEPSDRGKTVDFRKFMDPLVRASSWISRTVGDISRKRREKKEEKERRFREERLKRAKKVDDILSGTEIHIDSLLSRVDRSGGISERQRLLRRLKSALPEVRGLALEGLKDSLSSQEVLSAVEESVCLYGLDEVGVEVIVSISDPMSSLRLAMAAAPHFGDMTLGAARRYLRWLRGLPGGPAVYAGLQDPVSSQVAGLLISHWPQDLSFLPESRVSSLLERDQEDLLVPLLRQLYRRGCPRDFLPRIEEISQNSPSPAVKAWSRAIVCRSTVV
ncbi:MULTISPECIES: J domain-containing protein [Dethiosulfovibrio]|uniref:J domain-containing protein n=2 Tax=Dethiosulfovibrio TaxID=47054 RepID=A0ABS9EKH7_9BACT|nr:MULTISPECIES: J domain-containing protein [Dethiosulfovibrio]MCF4113874.1 J domain-containing protein [Dethiosulfovibrio russensis]MCF4141713.1 J domain-containing protein [Dethiosulfovibrio marinus]MCF4143870.1 J domain-containing protein [Dethiosulfovibrio acidaminovorans]